ncbi:hypothetical protein ABPG72_005151 [Tetrahymena utriculariae]
MQERLYCISLFFSIKILTQQENEEVVELNVTLLFEQSSFDQVQQLLEIRPRSSVTQVFIQVISITQALFKLVYQNKLYPRSQKGQLKLESLTAQFEQQIQS